MQKTVVVFVLFFPIFSLADKVYGIARPSKEIDIAVSETAIVKKVAVKEGDMIKKGQVIAQLDTKLLSSAYKIAIVKAKAKGNLQAAATEIKQAEKKLKRLELLEQRGSARTEEVEQAKAQVELAKSRHTAIKENLNTFYLEAQKIRQQISMRTIRSSSSGIVREVYKDPGESIPATQPICRIVQLDPLKIIAYPKVENLPFLELGSNVEVFFPTGKRNVTGKISFVDPVIDTASNTVKVVITVANPQMKILGGSKCQIILGKKDKI